MSYERRERVKGLDKESGDGEGRKIEIGAQQIQKGG